MKKNSGFDIIPSMNERFFRENEYKVNKAVQKGLMCLLFVIPTLWIFTMIGVFEIDRNQMLCSSVFIFAAAIVPRAFIGRIGNQSNVKYLTMTCVAMAVGMLNVIPTVGTYITLIIAVVISLMYADPRLTAFCSILQYVIMLVTEFFRILGIGETQFDITLLGKYIGFACGYTIEFIVMCSLCVFIAGKIRENQIANGDSIDELGSAKQRYEIVLENSSDIIFEYEIDKDLLTYFGPLLPSDVKNGVKYNEPVCIEHFFSGVQSDMRYHPDDVEIMQQLINGGIAGVVTIRMPVVDDWEWIEIEGNMVYKDNTAMKIMGKLKNVTAQKLDEQAFLHNSERDNITGFFDRRIGIRILREHATEAGRTDSQTFLYVGLTKCDEIGLKAGSAFKNAVIMRVADILRQELSDMDLPVRFSECEFILYLANRNAIMLEQMLARIEEECSRLYLGEGIVDSVGLKMETFVSIKDVEHAVLNNGLFESIDEIKNSSIRDDIAGFAFNLLENSIDFKSSFKLLMERVGIVYSLDAIRFLHATASPGQYRCLYEWISDREDAPDEPVLLNTTLGIGKLQSRKNTYVYECVGMEGKSDYIAFSGESMLEENTSENESELDGVSSVMASFMIRQFSADMRRAKLDFLNTMSDEIKVPMNAISGMAEMIEQEEPSDLIMFYTQDIKDYAEKLQSVLQDILELAHIESGQLDIISDRFYLHSVIEEVKNIMNIRIRNSGNQLVSRCDSNVPDGLVADRMRLREILLKLLESAVEVGNKGTIGMELSWVQNTDDAGMLTIVIWDSAKSYSEEELENLFSSNNHSVVLAGRLVDLMRGTIKADNSNAGGRKITFSIPCEVFDFETYDYDHLGSDSLTNNNAAIPFTAPWARILIVDDDSVNMEVMKGVLGKYKAQIVTATSGLEAVGILDKDDDYDLIFMDYMMPEMDGIETVKLIRGKGNPVLERIPVVCLTSFYEKGIESKLFMAGMNACLAKPVNLKELADVMTMFIPEEKREG